MKARILNKEFKGIYSDEFISNNFDNIINGELVSNWQLVNKLPTDVEKKYVKLMFDNDVYYDGASQQEIEYHIKFLINNYNKQQFLELSNTDWYVTRKNEIGVDIPQDVIDERNLIRLKYDNLKLELYETYNNTNSIN